MSERARPLALAAFLSRPQAEEQIGAFDMTCIANRTSFINPDAHAIYAWLT